MDTIHIIAHRGASGDRPENTVAAFTEAVRQGADGVELDVRPTADRHLIVSHDPVLPDGRTVAETPLAEFPAHMCDLSDALDACEELMVNVEIKHDPREAGDIEAEWLANETVRVVAESAPRGGVLISSFDPGILDLVRRLPEAPPTGLLTLSPVEPFDAVERAGSLGHAALHPWDPMVDQELVNRCHSAGLAVNVWTVDDPQRVRQLADWGVDAVITNWPAATRAGLAAHGASTKLD